MGAILTDRDSLERAFYRLLNTDATDDALTEHDPDDYDREAVYQALQSGVWDAQQFLIDQGAGYLWQAAFPIRPSYLAADDEDDEFRYIGSPSDFIRMAGDEDTSSLREPNGGLWGQLIEPEYRFRLRGNYFWLQRDRLYFGNGASIPALLYLDYYALIPELAVGNTVDLPERERPLAVVWAAVNAFADDWVAGGPEMGVKLERKLERLKGEASRRARTSRKPRKFRTEPGTGSHWFV